MTSFPKLRVVLFALTGFGNPVLKALMQDARVDIRAVFTVKYKNPFPYYEEMQLADFCVENGIEVFHGVMVGSEQGISLLGRLAPDLILVSTFKQILTANVINLPALGVVNFHPSLLPKYRGACPSNAALLNDETTSGLTAHYVTEGLDDGDILLQRGFGIQDVENDGQLRYKLARLAGEITPEVIQLFSGFQKPAGKPQNHALASSAPKPAIEDGFLENARTIQELRCKVRAYNPIPGTSIFVNGRRVAVDRFELFTSRRNDGIVEKEDSIEVTLNHEAINLFIKR